MTQGLGGVLRDETFCDLWFRFVWSVPFLRVVEILKHGKNFLSMAVNVGQWHFPHFHNIVTG